MPPRPFYQVPEEVLVVMRYWQSVRGIIGCLLGTLAGLFLSYFMAR